jgi:hypothetical protein
MTKLSFKPVRPDEVQKSARKGRKSEFPAFIDRFWKSKELLVEVELNGSKLRTVQAQLSRYLKQSKKAINVFSSGGHLYMERLGDEVQS